MADATRYLAAIRAEPSKCDMVLSDSSVNKHKRNLKSAFNVAVKQLGYLTVNPFVGLDQDKIPDQDIRYVEPSEYNALIATTKVLPKKSLWWEAFVTVCYTAGTRANETTHLTWGDIDFAENTIRIIAKREAGTWSEGQHVVNNLDRDFKRIAKAAGVQNVRLHDLRRSCITHWTKRLTVLIVQELAGHSNIETTRKYYVKIRPADMEEAREVTANALLLDAK
ncbi:MAG: tyrosine-type recombinase/integrase [Phycisphaerae bacterium]